MTNKNTAAAASAAATIEVGSGANERPGDRQRGGDAQI
jgi:hypothetical protein